MYNLTPRQGQVQIINKILIEYLDNKKKHVILSASTGCGKSIIGVIVTESLYRILDNKEFQNCKSIILMNNNALVNQYYNTFCNFEDFMEIKGKTNYDCELFRDNASICDLKTIDRNSKICSKCEYRLSKIKYQTTPNVISNYNYFLSVNISAFGRKNQKYNLMNVYDECHLINSVFCNTSKVEIKEKTYLNLIRVCEKSIENPELRTQVIEEINQLRGAFLNSVNQKNYMNHLNGLGLIQIKVKKILMNKLSNLISQNMIQLYKFTMKVINTLDNNSLQKLLELNYEHVVDIIKDRDGVQLIVEPVFINSIFSGLQETSRYNLFMSATVNKEYIITTLGLDEDETTFIKTDPVFDPSSKKVVFVDHKGYNYKNMNQLSHKKQMVDIIKEILKVHTEENGIIISPSFNVVDDISSIMKHGSGKYTLIHKLCIHTKDSQGGLTQELNKFKQLKVPSILISPSLFEGIDLVDDYSRFQIMIKAPYAPLTNKRIKFILQKYPDMYKIETIFKIVQGFGRSTRSNEDSSITYCLDSNIHKLFNDKFNIWTDEFQIITL